MPASQKASEPSIGPKFKLIVAPRPVVWEEAHAKRRGRSDVGSAEDFYLSVVSKLRRQIESAKIGDPHEFHSLFWLTMSLGAKPSAVADELDVKATVVSRWLHRGSTPPPGERRREILRAAWKSLHEELAHQIPVNRMTGRRANIAEDVQGVDLSLT